MLLKSLKEKSKTDEGWINGGFFVIKPEFLDYIKGDRTYLEREPLELASKKKQLIAFKHYKFWQCMDTKRDRDYLNKIYKKNYQILKKKILIVGGTGFIGYHLGCKLLKKWRYF